MATPPSDHASRSPSMLQSFSPVDGSLLGEVPISEPSDVALVLARARRAQEAWKNVPLEERCERLLRLRDAFVDRAEEIIEIVSRETGKPRNEALSQELFVFVDLLTYYCKNATRILQPEGLGLHLFKHLASQVSYVPRGVIGIISPWNFPLSIPMNDVAAALVTGSAAVVKPSEVTPLVMKKAKEIFDASGLPEDLLGVVYGDGRVGQALIDGGIQKLVFTGGVATGRKVAAACGAALVPCVMELGGKAPLIACADCDLERTARAIVYGGFANGGQACIAVERVYAEATIYDALVDRVGSLTRELRVSSPEGSVDVGALTFDQQRTIAEGHIADAVGKGARVVCGGRRKEGPGQFFEPTVLADCTSDMTVMSQEIFGPVVPLQKVSSEDEAIALANESHLGLNAYVFTKDRVRGRELAARIEAGSVVVNDVLINYAVAEAPFGGIKQSGFGRVHGDGALRDMSDTRHILSSRVPEPSRDPLWFPYSDKGLVWQLRGLRALFSSGSVIARIRRLF